MTPQRTVYVHKNDKQFQTGFRQAFTQHIRNISCGLFPTAPPPSSPCYDFLLYLFFTLLHCDVCLSDSFFLFLCASLDPLPLLAGFPHSICISSPFPSLAFLASLPLKSAFLYYAQRAIHILDTMALPMRMKWSVSYVYILHWH